MAKNAQQEQVSGLWFGRLKKDNSQKSTEASFQVKSD